MSLEHILLALLKEPASGYELRIAFEESIRHFWSADLAQIYPTLKKLEARGLLQVKSQPSEKGPDRKVYRRTAAGRRELLDWLRSGPRLGVERFAYIAQLAFMHELGDLRETRQFLVALREKLSAWLAALEKIEREELKSPVAELSDEEFHHYLGLRMGLHSLAAKVNWCNEAIRMVEAKLEREAKHA